MDNWRAAARRRLDPEERFGLRVTLLFVAAILVTAPFATLLFQVVAGGPITRMDGRVADALNRSMSPHPLAVDVVQAVSWFGKPVPLAAVVVVAAVYIARRRQHRLMIFLLATTAGGGLLNSAVKALVDRPRPIVDHPIAGAAGSSFPSGHSMGAMVVVGALVLVFLPAFRRPVRRLVVVAAALVVLAIGTTRLLLGVHFVSDVVGGFVLGAAWLSAATAAFAVWRADEGSRRASPLEEGVEPEAGPSLRLE